MQRRFKLKTTVFMFLVMLGLAVGIGSGSASETLLLKFRETIKLRCCMSAVPIEFPI